MMDHAPRGDAVHGPNDCEAAVRRLWDYLDGRLSTMSHREVESHLESCAGCPPHFAFAHAMKQALAAAPRPVAVGDDARLRERVREALRRVATAGDTDSTSDEERGRSG